MMTVGRIIARFPADRKKYFGTALTETGVRVDKDREGISQHEFISAWESFVKHGDSSLDNCKGLGNIVFALLDVYGCNSLADEEMTLLTHTLSRLAMHMTLLKFQAWVKKHFTTVDEAFVKCFNGELAPVEVAFKEKDRRRSGRSGRSKSSSSR